MKKEYRIIASSLKDSKEQYSIHLVTYEDDTLVQCSSSPVSLVAGSYTELCDLVEVLEHAFSLPALNRSIFNFKENGTVPERLLGKQKEVGLVRKSIEDKFEVNTLLTVDNDLVKYVINIDNNDLYLSREFHDFSFNAAKEYGLLDSVVFICDKSDFKEVK